MLYSLVINQEEVHNVTQTTRHTTGSQNRHVYLMATEEKNRVLHGGQFDVGERQKWTKILVENCSPKKKTSNFWLSPAQTGYPVVNMKASLILLSRAFFFWKLGCISVHTGVSSTILLFLNFYFVTHPGGAKCCFFLCGELGFVTTFYVTYFAEVF